MPHIFVGYGRVNSAYVSRLVAWLTRAGVDVWYDRDGAAGLAWQPQLLDQIRLCRALLVVMTPDSAA